jgi:uncharacterized protein YciI
MGKYLLFFLLFASVLRAADSSSYFFVFLDTNPHRPTIDKDSMKRLQAGHLENMNRLYHEGKLVVSGPFADSIAGGVFILKSESMETLTQMLATDPAINAQRYALEIFPLTIRNGSICTAPAENDMAMYPFARLAINNNISKEQRALHEQYYHDLKRSKQILFQGNLGDSVSIVIFAQNDKLDSTRALVMSDPAVSDMRPSVRPWWNARGVFCEEVKP